MSFLHFCLVSVYHSSSRRDNFSQGVVFLLAVSLSITFFLVYQQRATKNGKFSGTSKKTNAPRFVEALLLLASAVIKADGKILPNELAVVHKRISRDFSKARAYQYIQQLDECLNKTVKVEKICAVVKKQFTVAQRIQLMYFLIGTAVSNGLLVDAEYNLLKKITLQLGLSSRQMNSLFSMYDFERVAHQYQHQTNEKTRPQKSQASKLNRAYTILEITPSATVNEIKKAYRKLAKLHHPDKVIHLGADFQKNAKRKFQLIANAYALIKEKRKIP